VQSVRSHENGANPRACLVGNPYDDPRHVPALCRGGDGIVSLGEALGAGLHRPSPTSLDDLESPIERMFAVGWLGLRPEAVGFVGVLARCAGPETIDEAMVRLVAEHRPAGADPWAPVAVLFPQVPILNYRVDFVAALSCSAMIAGGHAPARLVVECDGRDFHGAGDQQDRDQRREDDLQAAGWEVVRFSGSSLNRDGYAAARVVRTRLLQKAAEGAR
jgi:very-short-patch-repair endonuclease